MSALDDTLDDLAGFGWIPGIQNLLDGITAIQAAANAGQLTPDATQTLLSLLGNPHGPDLQAALSLLAPEITNPDTNPALASLDPHTAKEVQFLGEMHAHDTADYASRKHTNEAAGLITGT
ncbi:hypothetical protein [Streptomyces sp. MBT28]|uniref:hypothetical protein n=1 Tax=Streptomyces sp. MBT28 TaxID=1488357 RepID=UPI0006191EA3|nr:hypothetical protein [Streptomyces sp. MBT28]